MRPQRAKTNMGCPESLGASAAALRGGLGGKTRGGGVAVSDPRTVYKIAAKRTYVGEVEAADEREAVEKAAAEFGVVP